VNTSSTRSGSSEASSVGAETVVLIAQVTSL
jgi:hypothetical protein